MFRLSIDIKLVGLAIVTAMLVVTFPPETSAFEDVGFVQDITGSFQESTDVVVSQEDGTIYVLDKRLSQILVYDETGYYLKTIGAQGSGPGEFRRPQSIALSPNNEIVIADTGNNRIQVLDGEGVFLYTFGSSGSLRGQFSSPTGVAVSSDGMIAVADSRNMRVQFFSPKGVYRYRMPFDDQPIDVAIDRNKSTYVLRPAAGVVSKITNQKVLNLTLMVDRKDYLSKASGLAVDRRGSVYITESYEHSIKKFTRDDGLLLSFGSEGKSRGQFKKPLGIFVDHRDRIYVADSVNKRVQILEITGDTKDIMPENKTPVAMVDFFENVAVAEQVADVRVTPSGSVLSISDRNNVLTFHSDGNRVVGSSGRDAGRFSYPTAIDFGPDERIYVADSKNNRVQIFHGDGTFDYQFGERGSKTGQFSTPSGIAVNSNGVIFVADTNNNRIQMFNKDGIFMRSFGSRSVTKKDAIPADGTFNMPTSLYVDSRDRLFVVDGGNHRIQIFDDKGKHIDSIGSAGDRYGQFNEPVDVAVDREGYVYIADAGNNRIQVIMPGGKQPIVFGSVGAGNGQFQSLTGVDVYNSYIFVSDHDNENIRTFVFKKNFVQKKKKPLPKIEEPKEVIEDEGDDEYELL